MAGRTVLIAGASGLVGHAALRHFAAEPDCAVVALSRRRPHDTRGARFLSVDLTDRGQVAALSGALSGVTHLVYAALFEMPALVDGWRDTQQIATNDRMLRNLLGLMHTASPHLRHVTLLQGTKAYGVHVRPLQVPAREGRSEMREQANFYWQQEDYVRERQRGQSWSFTILRPVLIVGEALGGAMNLIPATGAWAACLKDDGAAELPYPGGAERVAQAVDADLLARAIGWAGEAPAARNEVFNVTNGDVFTWPNVWPAIAEANGMRPGPPAPLSLAAAMQARAAQWDAIRARHGLLAPDLANFVGLSLQYADYTMGLGRAQPGPPAIVSTIKIMQAGFTEVMDTEAMFRKWFARFREVRLLPPV